MEYSSYRMPCQMCREAIGVFAYLSCGVDDLGCKVLILVLDDLAECVLNRWIVALDKVAIYELDGEGGFAWSRVSIELIGLR
jgi:hypothetical protein